MNRPGAGPQRIGGIPGAFSAQAHVSQNRTAANRLPPSGKIPTNGTTWAFGTGISMGGGGVGSNRLLNNPMTGFAQSIGGSSQAATQLDPSEYPSLSNNQVQPSQAAWASLGTRSAGPTHNVRLQQSALPSQQQLNPQHQTQQQDDLFGSSAQLLGGGGFRFGGQSAMGQSAPSSTAEEFPPLNRAANGDLGQDRSSNMLQSVGFGAPSNRLGFAPSNSAPQQHRSNGLLSALSGSSRVAIGNRVTSPGLQSAVSSSRSPVEVGHIGPTENAETTSNPFSGPQSGGASALAPRDSNPILASMNTGFPSRQDSLRHSLPHAPDSGLSSSQINAEESVPEAEDPLSHLNSLDKWGINGFSFMMKNFPDYASLVTGSDISILGFDLNIPSTELFSNQIYSLWDNELARPAIPHFALPECYQVMNTAPLDTKMSNFSDEALIFMFYSNPNDLQQVMAAQELHNRNWRYHKKLQLWLTKDDMMVPQALGNGTERGYYIFFDIKQWHKERRELTLIYDDLENLPNGPRVSLV